MSEQEFRTDTPELTGEEQAEVDTILAGDNGQWTGTPEALIDKVRLLKRRVYEFQEDVSGTTDFHYTDEVPDEQAYRRIVWGFMHELPPRLLRSLFAGVATPEYFADRADHEAAGDYRQPYIDESNRLIEEMRAEGAKRERNRQQGQAPPIAGPSQQQMPDPLNLSTADSTPLSSAPPSSQLHPPSEFDQRSPSPSPPPPPRRQLPHSKKRAKGKQSGVPKPINFTRARPTENDRRPPTRHSVRATNYRHERLGDDGRTPVAV